VKLRYLGTKPLPYVLNTPIPFVSRCEQTGSVAFTPEADVLEDWGTYLLEHCAGAFERVDQPVVVADQAPRHSVSSSDNPLKYIGKRFSGKAGKYNAVAFIRTHGGEDLLGIRKLQIRTAVIFWEIVAIALADVKCSDMAPAWNKGQVGSIKAAIARNRERIQHENETIAAQAVGLTAMTIHDVVTAS